MSRRSNLIDLEEALTWYIENFRKPGLPDLKLSDLYDLFPPSPDDSLLTQWPAPWPNVNSAGVYFVFDANRLLVYIGKSSMNSSVGFRLSSYFGFDENWKCRLKHPQSWIGKPRYVTTIGMDPEFCFEAPALEEYLIARLPTTDNRAGA